LDAKTAPGSRQIRMTKFEIRMNVQMLKAPMTKRSAGDRQYATAFLRFEFRILGFGFPRVGKARRTLDNSRHCLRFDDPVVAGASPVALAEKPAENRVLRLGL
jgi:hypothetical protein